MSTPLTIQKIIHKYFIYFICELINTFFFIEILGNPELYYN
jgi:hypothetical protein